MSYRDDDRYENDHDLINAVNRDRKIAELKKRGLEVHEDRKSGYAYTSRSTILPDGTEVMDM